MESSEEGAARLSRKRKTGKLFKFKEFIRKRRIKVAGGDEKNERTEKLSKSGSSNDNGNSGPAFVQDEDQQIAVAASNSYGACDQSQNFRRDSWIDDASPCSLSGLESFASESVHEDRASSSILKNAHDLVQEGSIGSQEDAHKIWEKERSKLEEDHKIQVAFIRCMYRHSRIGNAQLALLEKEFSHTLEKHNLLKKASGQQQSSDELQIQDSAAVEIQSASVKEVLTSAIDSAGSKSPDLQVPLSDDVLAPTSPVDECLASETSDQPNPVSPIASGENLCGNELLDQGTSLPQVAEPVRRQSSGELQSQASPAMETQSVSETEVLTSSMLDNAGSKLPTLQLPLADGVVPPISSADKCLDSEKFDQPHHVSLDASCENLCDTELMDQGTNSPQVAENVTRSSGELQSQDSPVVENQSVSVADCVVAPTLSADKFPVSEESEQPFPASVNISFGENQSDKELQGQGINSPKVGKPVIKEAGSKVSLSSNLENLLRSMGFSRQPACDVASAKFPLISPVTLPSEHTGVQIHYQAPPSVGVVLNHGVRPSFQNSTQQLPARLFHHEIEKVIADAAELEKNHQNMMSTLKSDCERELSEMIIQIRMKYGLKLKEAEVEFRLKQDELNRKQKKILLNQMLANTFRSKGSVPSGSVQQHRESPYQSTWTSLQLRPSVGSAAPGHGAYATSSQTGSTQPLSAQLAAFLSSSASRPFTPNLAYFPGNNGDIRAMAQSSTAPAVSSLPMDLHFPPGF